MITPLLALFALDYQLPLYEEIRQDERRLKAKKEIFLAINGVTYEAWTEYLEWVESFEQDEIVKCKERP